MPKGKFLKHVIKRKGEEISVVMNKAKDDENNFFIL